MKYCKKCKETKEDSEFYNKRLECKSCVKEYSKKSYLAKKQGEIKTEIIYRPNLGLEKHHWNLNLLHDYKVMDGNFRNKLKRYMKFNLDTKLWETLHGTVLGTKKKHYDYLNKITELINEF